VKSFYPQYWGSTILRNIGKFFNRLPTGTYQKIVHFTIWRVKWFWLRP